MSASYPTSVKAFTSRNAGDIIQPAHVNDLEDEVNAIEAGLLNGTAPLNSSKSTLATLSVLGNSTITGNQQVNGNSTIAGGLQVSGAVAVTGTMLISGALTVNAPLISSGGFALGAVTQATPASTGNTNDLAISSNTGILRLNVSGDSTLTGLAMGAKDGQFLLISNAGGGSLKIAHQTGSVSSNQFICPGNATLTVRTNGTIGAWYDGINGWFRLMGI